MIPKGMAPVLAGSGGTTRVADWSVFDARYGPVLSGESFRDLPRSGQPVEHFFLPYNLMWPSDYANFGNPAYRTESVRVGAEYRRHLAEKGWTRPTYQIYYNQKEAYGFFPFNLDEPTREQDMKALEELAEIDQEAFPKGSLVKVALRIDVGHLLCKNVPPDRCSKPSQMNERVVPALDPWVSVWNFGSDHFFFNAQEGQRLKTEGKTVWFYRAAEIVQSPLVRSVWRGWQGYRYGVDGTCYWNATDWVDWNTDKPFSDPFSYSTRQDQGKSLLLYPGSKFGYDGPIASIRFKAIRRGLQDFEYLKIIEAKGLKSRAELVEMIDRELLGPHATDYGTRAADDLRSGIEGDWGEGKPELI